MFPGDINLSVVGNPYNDSFFLYTAFFFCERGVHKSPFYSIYETYLIILTDPNEAYFMIEINNFMIRIKTCVHDHNN